jgi:hypothetical protein
MVVWLLEQRTLPLGGLRLGHLRWLLLESALTFEGVLLGGTLALQGLLRLELGRGWLWLALTTVTARFFLQSTLLDLALYT